MKTTIMHVVVHGDTEDPSCGGDVLDISLKNEGGGYFLSLNKSDQEICIDFNEWEEVVRAVNVLIAQSSVR